MIKAVFFDRDGVVNRRIIGGYVKSPKEFIFIDGFFDFFRLIKENDFLAILVTNQQGIGKGLMSKEQLYDVHNFMNSELLASTGFEFDSICYCPDLASSNSSRRKPQPGMFSEAIEKFGIDPSISWTIGDSKSDAQAGKSAATKTILIGQHQTNDFTDYVFPSIIEIKEFFEDNII